MFGLNSIDRDDYKSLAVKYTALQWFIEIMLVTIDVIVLNLRQVV